MIISYSIIWGIGLAMVDPMLYTIIGEQFPLDRRAQAIGWLMTSLSFGGIIGAPIIGIIAARAGWRWSFLGFVFPLLLLSLMMVKKGITSHVQYRHPSSKSQKEFWDGFQAILTNRSALACLLSSVFAMAIYQALGFFGASFFRERFLDSIRFVAILRVGSGFFAMAGSQVGGKYVNRVGRKPLTVFTAAFTGIFTILYTNINHLWLAITFSFLGFFFLAMMFTSSSSLVLEQVPLFRGTMMALNSASWYLGSAFGAVVGGLALIFFDYRILGLSLGLMGLAIALIYYFAINDPTPI